jgi:hypothetical protein
MRAAARQPGGWGAHRHAFSRAAAAADVVAGSHALTAAEIDGQPSAARDVSTVVCTCMRDVSAVVCTCMVSA